MDKLVGTDFSQFSDDDLRRVLKFMEVRETRLKFATQFHVNTKGERLEFDKFFHMKDLYNTLERRVVIMGGAQIGKTDWLVIEALAMAYNGLNVFFVLPKFDMRTSFVQEKVQRPLQLSPAYKSILKDSTFSRIEQMQFGKGVIKFVGSSVDADFTSFSADCLHGDCLVQTSLGDIKISELKDHVGKPIIYSYNETTGKTEVKRLIAWLKKPEPRPVYRFTFSDGRFLDCTDEHEIYAADSWVPIRYVYDGHILVQDKLTKTENGVYVESELFLGLADVYDIQVEDNHNFFSNGVLIHNCYMGDEIEKCDSEENIELGFSRMDSSIYKFERFISNPTTKSGILYRWYDASDKRLWMCPCDACHHETDLDFFKTVVEEVTDSSGNTVSHRLRDSDWKPGCGRDIRIICPKCDSGIIDRFHADRHWQPTVEGINLAAGYHMPSLISPMVSVSELYNEFREAIENPTKMARLYSMRFALPHSATGNRISEQLLENCVDENYKMELHADHACIPGDKHDGPCSMGIDVSPSHFDIRISHYDRGRRRAVYIGKIDVKSVYQLHEIAERYNVKVAVMDIGPEQLLAKEFQREAKCAVWLCKYMGQATDRSMNLNHNEMIVSIDRTEALDRGYSQLKTGKNILPRNYRYILDGVYQQEMCELVREINENKKTGELRYSWVGSIHNHHRHSDAYDLVAFEILSEDTLIGSECCHVG